MCKAVLEDILSAEPVRKSERTRWTKVIFSHLGESRGVSLPIWLLDVPSACGSSKSPPSRSGPRG